MTALLPYKVAIYSVAVCVYVCERVEWEALSYIKPN